MPWSSQNGSIINNTGNTITIPEKHKKVSHLQQGPVNNIEIHLKTKDGQIIPVLLSCSMMADNDNTPFGLVCIARDITGNKKLQEELQRVQKLESLGILAGGIAHDFKNLLNGIYGYIKVSSTSGQGTVFTIDLPVSDKELAPTQEKNPAKSLKGGWYILLMDDELFLLELLKEALEGMNYRVELSKNGEEAIQKYKAAMISGQAFDAVILDLTVHGGMGGKATVEKLLEIDPQVKGIASSGYSEDPIFANPKEYGFCGAIKKPYSIENLCEVLERVLGE